MYGIMSKYITKAVICRQCSKGLFVTGGCCMRRCRVLRSSMMRECTIVLDRISAEARREIDRDALPQV